MMKLKKILEVLEHIIDLCPEDLGLEENIDKCKFKTHNNSYGCMECFEDAIRRELYGKNGKENEEEENT